MWVLGNNLGSSSIIGSLSHWAISLVPEQSIVVDGIFPLYGGVAYYTTIDCLHSVSDVMCTGRGSCLSEYCSFCLPGCLSGKLFIMTEGHSLSLGDISLTNKSSSHDLKQVKWPLGEIGFANNENCNQAVSSWHAPRPGAVKKRDCFTYEKKAQLKRGERLHSHHVLKILTLG